MDISSFIKNLEMPQLNPLLVAVLVIMAVFTVSGYKKGFIKLAVSLFSMIAWMLIISVCMPYISGYLREKTDIYEVVSEKIGEALAETNAERDNTVPENRTLTIGNYRLPDMVRKMLLKNDNEAVYDSLFASGFEEYVSRFLADIVVKAIAFVTAYFIAMLIMKITLLSSEFVSSLPIIGGFNRLAGAVAGFAEGALIVLLIFTALTFIVGRPFYETVHTSRMLSLIYDNNPVLLIFSAEK